MGLDIRVPIGLMFSVFGLLLTSFGAFSNRAIYRASLGINVNVIWGLVLLVFGVVMLVFGRRAAHAGESKDEDTREREVVSAATRGTE
jgi:hypothetical protein